MWLMRNRNIAALAGRNNARAGVGLVNFKHSFIFNRIFEMQKSARNAKNFAKTRAKSA
jgi:hypothetical protein